MVREVEKAEVANMVWYNYRRIPAVTAKEMINEGRKAKSITTVQFPSRVDYCFFTQGGEGLWKLDAKVGTWSHWHLAILIQQFG